MKRLAPYLLILAACGELPQPEPPRPLWSESVEPLLDGCAECHAAAMSSYFALMSSCQEDGGRWVSPADPSSPLLTVFERADHQGLLGPQEQDVLRTWILEERAPFASTLAHEAGWIREHAQPLDPRPCADCHNDRPGGAIACTSCHEKPFGLKLCDNCHDHRDSQCDSSAERVSKRLHRMHTESTEFPKAECSNCHVVPVNILERGHFNDGTEGAEAKSCAVSACHSTKVPTWTEPAPGERCDRCHGNPPETHASSQCADCHQGANHLNRLLDVGRDCESCHPTEGLGGAHRAHRESSQFMNAIACESCHQVPADRDALGHIDTAPPAEVSLAFDRESGRCSDVGCHGAGLDGAAPRTEDWKDPEAEIACGSCHALPPVVVRGGASVHLPTGSADCGVCHRTAEGAPISVGIETITELGRAVHGNGRVDLSEEW